MARPKKAKSNEKTITKKVKADPRIERVYEEVVEFTCPIRGRVKQKVQIRKFKTCGDIQRGPISSDSAIDRLEDQDDGLSIYSEEELEESSAAEAGE